MTNHPARLRTVDELRRLAAELRADGHPRIADTYAAQASTAARTVGAITALGSGIENARARENDRSMIENVGMDMARLGRDVYAVLVAEGWVPPTELYTAPEQPDLGDVLHDMLSTPTTVQDTVDAIGAKTDGGPQGMTLCLEDTTTGPCVLALDHGNPNPRGGSGGHLSQAGVNRWKYVGQDQPCPIHTKTGPCMLERDHLGGHHSQAMMDLVADAESKGLI